MRRTLLLYVTARGPNFTSGVTCLFCKWRLFGQLFGVRLWWLFMIWLWNFC